MAISRPDRTSRCGTERMTQAAVSRRVTTLPGSMPASTRRRSESRFSSSSGIASRNAGDRRGWAGPRFFFPGNMRGPLPLRTRSLLLLFLLGALAHSGALAATGWIPPRRITTLLPGATVAPGSVHTLQMTIRANGVPASLDWTVTTGGPYPLGVSPGTGSIDVPADSIGRVTFTVTAPPETAWVATISVELRDQL